MFKLYIFLVLFVLNAYSQDIDKSFCDIETAGKFFINCFHIL